MRTLAVIATVLLAIWPDGVNGGVIMKTKRRVVFLMAAILLPGAAAWGQGVGGNSPTQSSHSIQVVPAIPEAVYTWAGDVGTINSPVGVELDPSGPAWTKEFQPDTTFFPSIQPQQVALIAEYLIVEGDLPWTGWSMDIVTSGFEWFPRTLGGYSSAAIDAGGDPIFVHGQLASLDPSRVDFSFDSIPAGTTVRISAYVRYAGTEPFTGDVELRQYPTPEPASALMLISLLALTPFRRR